MAPRDDVGFQVQPATLDEFAARMHRCVDEALDPRATQFAQTFGTGSTFGYANVSRAVSAARGQYVERCNQANALMAELVRQGNALASTCEDVARSYRSADQAAATNARQKWGGTR